MKHFGLFLRSRHFFRLHYYLFFRHNFRFQFFLWFLNIHYSTPLFESLHLLDIATQSDPQGQLAKIHADRARHHAVHRGYIVELVLRIVQYILDAKFSPGHYKTFVVLLINVHLKYDEF